MGTQPPYLAGVPRAPAEKEYRGEAEIVGLGELCFTAAVVLGKTPDEVLDLTIWQIEGLLSVQQKQRAEDSMQLLNSLSAVVNAAINSEGNANLRTWSRALRNAIKPDSIEPA